MEWGGQKNCVSANHTGSIFSLLAYVIVSGQTTRNGTFYNAMFCSLFYCMLENETVHHVHILFLGAVVVVIVW